MFIHVISFGKPSTIAIGILSIESVNVPKPSQKLANKVQQQLKNVGWNTLLPLEMVSWQVRTVSCKEYIMVYGSRAFVRRGKRACILYSAWCFPKYRYCIIYLVHILIYYDICRFQTYLLLRKLLVWSVSYNTLWLWTHSTPMANRIAIVSSFCCLNFTARNKSIFNWANPLNTSSQLSQW